MFLVHKTSPKWIINDKLSGSMAEISWTRSPTPPPFPVPAAAALRMRPAPPGVSACSAGARSFSPLCYTDSGFNSDSTQTSSGPRGSPNRLVRLLSLRWKGRGVFSCGGRGSFRFGLRGFGPGSLRDTLLFKRVCVVVVEVVVVYGGAGPCSCTPGMRRGGFPGGG